MVESFQKQTQIKILPALSFNGGLRLRETELNEVVRMVENVLPQYVKGDIDVTITLLEKNLKIMADMVVMRETLTHLIESAMDAVPSGGKFLLSTNQPNCGIESLPDGDHSPLGVCALISLADAGLTVDEKMKDKIFEPVFTTKTNSKGLGLPIAYRIIKQHHGKLKLDSWRERGTKVNMYLPLTKSEIVSMMTIPLGQGSGRIH